VIKGRGATSTDPQGGLGRSRGSNMAEGRLFGGKDASPGRDAAPISLNNIVARRPLLGEAGALERVVRDVRRDDEAKAHQITGAYTITAGRRNRRRVKKVNPSQKGHSSRGLLGSSALPFAAVLRPCVGLDCMLSQGPLVRPRSMG
jgi:hypothetical protein